MNDGQTDAALEQYKIIAEPIPRMPRPICAWRKSIRKSGKFDQALESLKKAGVHGAGLD